jgi:hypothetical protein
LGASLAWIAIEIPSDVDPIGHSFVVLAAYSLDLDIWSTSCSGLAFALLIDSIGRVLCWMGQVIPSRSLLLSTEVQLSVILVAFGFATEIPHNPPVGVFVLILLVSGQLISAFTFNLYLKSLEEHIRFQKLMVISEKVTTSLVSGTILTTILVIIVSVQLFLGFVSFMFLYYLGPLIVLFIGSIVVIPLWIAILVLAMRVLVNYGILLFQLRSALQVYANQQSNECY